MSKLPEGRPEGLRQATGLAAGLLCILIAGTSGHAQSPDTHQVSAECRGSATYFAEFYAGLQTMHSHGLTHFVPGSADAQAYFIQVQSLPLVRQSDQSKPGVVIQLGRQLDFYLYQVRRTAADGQTPGSTGDY